MDFKKVKDEPKKATADVIIGEIYKDNINHRVFIAMAKDDSGVYDATGWFYMPNNITLIKNK